jgi:hypothetical protein
MLFYLGDDKTLEAIGMGNIEIIMTMGDKKNLILFSRMLYTFLRWFKISFQ